MRFNTFSESVVKIKHLELFGEQSHAKMSPPYRLDLAERMKENGFDSALAIHLEEQRSETLEVKGDPGAAVPIAGTMTMRPQVFSDDFFVNEDIYQQEQEQIFARA